MTVVEAVPGHRRATIALLECLLNEEEHEQAVRLLETLTAEDRSDYEGRVLSCRVYLATGDYMRAQECLERGRTDFPGQAFWDRAGSIVALAKNDLPAARESLAAYAAKEPDDASCRARLAELFLEEKDFDKAAEWAKQALRVDSRQAAMLRIVGRQAAKKRQFARARVWYDDAITLNGDLPEWRVEYAEVLIALKDSDQARRQLEIVLSGDPEHVRATELLTKLPPPAAK
jgi:tetratricopeptide (TPR) repeat protein